jgi:hypothetical protein
MNDVTLRRLWLSATAQLLLTSVKQPPNSIRQIDLVPSSVVLKIFLLNFEDYLAANTFTALISHTTAQQLFSKQFLTRSD